MVVTTILVHKFHNSEYFFVSQIMTPLSIAVLVVWCAYYKQRTSYSSHFLAMILSGVARETTAPDFSVMSMTLSLQSVGSVQSKWYNSDPRIKCTILYANGSPRHIRRPALNGISSESFPQKLMYLPINLSGKNLSGSVQISDFRLIAHMFMIMFVLFGPFDGSHCSLKC